MASDNQSKDVLEARVVAIREQVQRGEYQVDAQAVAEAILRRLMAIGPAPAGAPQKECSYPDNSPS